DYAADFNHEHYGIAHHVPRIELDERVDNRTTYDLPVPNRFLGTLPCHCYAPQKVLPAPISRCSRIGPRLSAGKNVSAPTMRITPINNVVNSGVVTGNVPSEGGIYFFCARLPAMASIGIIIRKRPISIVNPPVVLYQRVFPLIPPKAEPLFPADEVKR